MFVATDPRPDSVPAVLTASSPELQVLIDGIREGAAARDRDRIAPHAQIALIRTARLGALRVPVAQGGGGASLRELFGVVIRLGEADPNVAHILRNHFAFVEKCLRAAPGDRYRDWLGRVVDGTLFGLASTELGSIKAGGRDYATTLNADGDGYRLNGTKYYSTGNLYSDWIVVRASVSDGRAANVIIPADRTGVTLDDDWDGIGQRLTGTGTTRFGDVHVGENEVIFDVEALGHKQPYQATFPQLYLTAVIAGILRNVVRDATTLVLRRPRSYYHAPAERAADDPILQQVIGQLSAGAFAAETMVLAAADAMERAANSVTDGLPDPELALHASIAAAKAKIVIDDIALRSASQLFDVGGASASKRSAQLDRHWRNVRTLASHNPASYKARAIGEYEISGKPLPRGSFF